MLEIPGAPALSAFRIAKLLDRLRALEPAVRGLAARFVHFADLERPLDDAERGVLGQLLTYGPSLRAADGAAAGERVLVVPRAGTISPWSSKASDIVHVCGLTSVRRVERGI
jgi:phosphoribosylformylglycinamidine synthase